MGQKNTRVFWLPLRPSLRTFPEALSGGLMRILSTVTAAGQRRPFTVFPEALFSIFELFPDRQCMLTP
jgi:hypothetical protein